MKKYYIIGAITLLVVIGGSAAFYEYEHSPKIEYQKGLSYYKDKNYQKALPLFEEAAKQGYAPAEEKLGHMYLKGWGVPQNTNTALYWFKKAAEQGDAEAENYLGAMYLKGLGVPQDYSKAAYWIKKAAEQGYTPAKANLKRLESEH